MKRAQNEGSKRFGIISIGRGPERRNARHQGDEKRDDSLRGWHLYKNQYSDVRIPPMLICHDAGHFALSV